MLTEIKMQEGERFARPSNKPIISFQPAGRRSVLWVGNNAPNDMMCFATLSGRKTLRRLANAILRATK